MRDCVKINKYAIFRFSPVIHARGTDIFYCWLLRLLAYTAHYELFWNLLLLLVL